MIYIDRNRLDDDGNPIKPDDNWVNTADAATSISKTERGSHDADDNIYAHDKVRAALEELFHSKCAYCEKELPEQWDVEHYRPKGRVAENKTHPGYYWLSYEWENLFPACTHCNQRRKDKPIWGDLTYAQTGGKADQFPLTDEVHRVMAHDCGKLLENEVPLLINPCNENPEQFITFGINGQILSIDDNPKGKATIEICNLKRRRLKETRKEAINKVIKLYKLYLELSDSGNTVAANSLHEIIESNFLSDSSNYAASARTVINDPNAFGLS